MAEGDGNKYIDKKYLSLKITTKIFGAPLFFVLSYFKLRKTLSVCIHFSH